MTAAGAPPAVGSPASAAPGALAALRWGSLDDAVRAFRAFGETDEAYLRFHWRRFTLTRSLVEETAGGKALRILDVGAHWLHQAALFAARGHAVTATDLPLTLERPAVRDLGAAWGVALVPNDDLEHPGAAWSALPDGGFDRVLLTEILEHLAFNPLGLWREIHRVLAVGGRVVLSTPNYYALRGLLPRVLRVLRGRGGGIPCQAILGQPTYAHHWKEYAVSELVRYFRLLSPDFRIHRALYLRDYYPARSAWAGPARAIEAAIPFLRPNLHVEVELVGREAGITAEPAWAG